MRVRATLRLRNDALVSARERLGLTQAEAAEKCGVPLPYYVGAEQFNLRGGNKKGRRPMLIETAMAHAAKVAKGMGLPIEAVLSHEFLDRAPTAEVSVVAEMSPRGLLEASSRFEGRNALPADALCRDADVSGALRTALEKLPTRHRQVMTLRYGLDGGGERSLDEVAKEMRVTKERVRKLESVAKWMLQGNTPLVRVATTWEDDK